MSKDGNYLYGKNGETLARNYMETKGFRCLGSRIKTRFGELDLVVKKDNMVIL
jgi:Holliday junction resolvase-like predicted endonuclease